MDINKTPGALTLFYSDRKTWTTSNGLTLDEKGAHVHIGYSTMGMAQRALGAYDLPLDGADADVTAIRSEVQKLHAAGYKPPFKPPIPDMNMKWLKIGLDGCELNFNSPAAEPVTPELVPIENGILRLMDRAAEKPVAALAMKLALTPEKVRVGAPLRIEIELSNPGHQPIDFLSPLTIVHSAFERFRLSFWRLTISGKYSECWCWPDLQGREFQVAGGGTLSRAPVRLEPGEARKISTTLRLPLWFWRPGRYMVQLAYATISPGYCVAEDGVMRIYGALHTERVPLKVVWLF